MAEEIQKRRERKRRAAATHYAAHREEILAKKRDRYQNDAELRERKCLQYRQWRADNPLKAREKGSRYWAQKKAATIGQVSYDQILERDGLWCYLCEIEVEPDDIHFDHVVPLSKGGEHSMENIKVTHSRCNLSKNDRLLETTTIQKEI